MYGLAFEMSPLPPNSHRSPEASIQETDPARGPGRLVGAATPCVPYTALAGNDKSGPATHVHSPVAVSYFHRSLR